MGADESSVQAVVGALLISRVRPLPAEWLELHSFTEAARDYRLHSILTRANRPAEIKEMRRLHRGALEPESERSSCEILSLTADLIGGFVVFIFLGNAFRRILGASEHGPLFIVLPVLGSDCCSRRFSFPSASRGRMAPPWPRAVW